MTFAILYLRHDGWCVAGRGYASREEAEAAAAQYMFSPLEWQVVPEFQHRLGEEVAASPAPDAQAQGCANLSASGLPPHTEDFWTVPIEAPQPRPIVDHVNGHGVPILRVEGPPDPDVAGYLHYTYGQQWDCRYCGSSFASERQLRDHLSSGHPLREVLA